MDRITNSDFLRLARRVKGMEELGAGDARRDIGAIALWPAATPPESWLLCDGSAVSRGDYADLFAVIGTAYGGGDGSTTFNLPNLKGRVAVGQNTAEAEFDTLGETGGEKAHTLSAAEMPSHNHEFNTIPTGDTQAWEAPYQTFLYKYVAGTHYVAGASSGGGGAHNNLPPYTVLNYIIRYQSAQRAVRGEKGDKGEAGVAGTSYRLLGEWSSGRAYSNGSAYIDCVTSDGSTYYCKVPHTGHAVSDAQYWGVLAQKGNTGAAGPAGQTGLTGPIGPTGAAYRMRGEYSAAATYANDSAYIDCVTVGGSTYYCKASHTGHAVTDEQYWGVLAQKGEPGETGPIGLAGAMGPQGPAGVTYRMRGEYSASAAYGNDSAYIDCVTYFGSTYYAKQDTAGNAPTDTVYWGLLAQKGADGAGDMTAPGQPVSDGDIAVFDGATGKVLRSAGKGLPAGPIADTGSTQTLSNKTLSAPVVTLPPANIARMPGEVTLWTGSSAPAGWLVCNGTAVSRVSYAALFAVIGTTYGIGDGSTTFNLPDLKGRVAVGQNGADAAFDALGETGGEKAHTLTQTEMPSHTHTQNGHSHAVSATTSYGGDHSHYIKWYVGAEKFVSLSGSGSGDSSSGYQTGYSSGTVYHEAMKAAPAGGHSHSIYIGSGDATAVNQYAGAGGTHNNLQPYLVLSYIIKF